MDSIFNVGIIWIIIYIAGAIIAGAVMLKFINPKDAISKTEAIAEIIFILIMIVLSWLGIIGMIVLLFFGLKKFRM